MHRLNTQTSEESLQKYSFSHIKCKYKAYGSEESGKNIILVSYTEAEIISHFRSHKNRKDRVNAGQSKL